MWPPSLTTGCESDGIKRPKIKGKFFFPLFIFILLTILFRCGHHHYHNRMTIQKKAQETDVSLADHQTRQSWSSGRLSSQVQPQTVIDQTSYNAVASFSRLTNYCKFFLASCFLFTYNVFFVLANCDAADAPPTNQGSPHIMTMTTVSLLYQ